MNGHIFVYLKVGAEAMFRIVLPQVPVADNMIGKNMSIYPNLRDHIAHAAINHFAAA